MNGERRLQRRRERAEHLALRGDLRDAHPTAACPAGGHVGRSGAVGAGSAWATGGVTPANPAITTPDNSTKLARAMRRS